MDQPPRKKKKGHAVQKLDDQQQKVASLVSQANPEVNMFAQLSSLYQHNLSLPTHTTTKNTPLLSTHSPNPLAQTSHDYFDPQVQKILQQLNKKSGITKYKAFQELQEVLVTKECSDFYQVFLPTFVFLYRSNMTLGSEKRVLLILNRILVDLVTRPASKAALAQQFKGLFPWWFIQQHDAIYDEVAQAAQEAFQKCFGDKADNAKKKCMAQFLGEAQSLMGQTVKAMSQDNQQLDDNQCLDILDRLQIGVLRGLVSLLEGTLSNDQLQLIATTLQLNTLEQPTHFLLSLYCDPNRPKVKGYLVQVYLLTLQLYQAHLSGPQQNTAIQAVLKSIPDPDRHTQRMLWTYNLPTLLKTLHSHKLWTVLSKDALSTLCQQFLNCVSMSAYGQGQSLYPQLVFVLAYLPFANTLQNPSEAISFLTAFFKALLKGFSHEESRFFAQEMTQSYFECLSFIMKKRCHESVLAEKRMQALIKETLFLGVTLFISQNNPSSIVNLNEYKFIPGCFASFLNQTLMDNQYLPDVFRSLFKDLQNYLVGQCSTPAQVQNYCQVISQINQHILPDSGMSTLCLSFLRDNLDLFLNMLDKNVGACRQSGTNTKALMENQKAVLKIFGQLLWAVYEHPHGHIATQLAQSQQLHQIQKVLGSLYAQDLSGQDDLCYHLAVVARLLIKLGQANPIYQSLLQTHLHHPHHILSLAYLLDSLYSHDHLTYLAACPSHLQAYQFLSRETRRVENTLKKQPPMDSQNELMQQLICMLFDRSVSDLSTAHRSVYFLKQALLTRANNATKQHVYSKIIEMQINKEAMTKSVLCLLLDQEPSDELQVSIYQQSLEQLQQVFMLDHADLTEQALLMVSSITTPVLKIIGHSIMVYLGQSIKTLLTHELGPETGRLERHIKVVLDIYKTHYQHDILRQFLVVQILPLFCHQTFNSALLWHLTKIVLLQVDSVVSLSSLIDQSLLQTQPRLFQVWLCAQNSMAILAQPPLQLFFRQTNNDHTTHVLLNLAQSDFPAFLNFVLSLYQLCLSTSLLFSSGLNSLLKQCFANDILTAPQQDQVLSIITDDLHLLLQSQLDQPQKVMHVARTLFHSLHKYLIDKPSIKHLQHKSLEQIVALPKENSHIDQMVLLADVLCQTLKMGQPQDIDPVQLQDIVAFLFSEQTVSTVKASPQNYVLSVLFDFVNIVSEQNGFIYFSDQLLPIEELFCFGFSFNSTLQNNYSQAIQQLLIFSRRVLSFLEAFSTHFQNFLSGSLLMHCNEIQAQLVPKGNSQQQVDELSYDLVVEIAETIGRFASAAQVYKEMPLDEDLLLTLLSSPFPPVQSSAFLLLNHLYQNLALYPLGFPELVAEKEEPELSQFLEEKVGKEGGLLSQHLVSLISQDLPLQTSPGDGLNPALHNYLLGWTLVCQKHSSQAFLHYSNEAKLRLNSLQQKCLQLFFEKDSSVYMNYLQKAFDALALLDLGHEQALLDLIGKTDFTLWLEQPAQEENTEMARILLKSLFEFAAVFPLFIRKWFQQAHKEEARQAEGLMKHLVSKAIFIREVQQIEVRQQDWKSEEFNIYVSPQTQEVVCVYEKEDSKIEINVQVPKNYPLQMITNIEHKRGLLLEQNKVKKLVLMMRSLLAKENNSILNSLLLWKENIDRQFEGVEECYICFCIVHASTKQLPKMSCKTCKHKFHSSCIQKWFDTKYESKCPLCKSQFL